MYAMDHTMHFEHRTTDARADRTDVSHQRTSRWDLRRLVSAQQNQQAQQNQPADADSNPVHGFLD